jgi:anti-sigma-K factor RskA
VKVDPRIAYAVVISLLALTLLQCLQIERAAAAQRTTVTQLRTTLDKTAKLEQSYALMSLRLVALDAKDPAYVNARVLVAWDGNMHRGTITMENFPLTPAGSVYQLWVLDPSAPSALSAGTVTGSRTFEVASCSTLRPGFAISLEPTGGSTTVTGPILFAVSPAE